MTALYRREDSVLAGRNGLAMPDLTAQRTLVKSPPELWSELSEVESLARHLGELGEIRITRVEPESTVAWEGEQISGTVELEQSGWGTKVTFHATVPEPDQAPGSKRAAADVPPDSAASDSATIEPEPAPEPVSTDPEPVASEREATVELEAVAVQPEPDPEPEPKPKRTGLFARWLFRERQPAPGPEAVTPEPEPEPVADEPEIVEEAELAPKADPVEPASVAVEPEAVVAEPAPGPDTIDAEWVQQVLDGTLAALGQAHHRPFSRG